MHIESCIDLNTNPCCAIIGLPNVGKTTLFNALTQSRAAARNFPFCTMIPNRGQTSIFDDRLDALSALVRPRRVVVARLDWVDTAGLVEGASTGKGHGTQFLSEMQRAHLLCQVVRGFFDAEVSHLYPQIDPDSDLRVVNTELMSFDVELCRRAARAVDSDRRTSSTQRDFILRTFAKCRAVLRRKKPLRTANFDRDEKRIVRSVRFLTEKPSMYVLNLRRGDHRHAHCAERVEETARQDRSGVFSVFLRGSCEQKRTQRRTDSFSAKKFLGLTCRLLRLRTCFTLKHRVLQSWLFVSGTSVSRMARRIHSSLQHGFIRAKIISFSDFVAHRSEASVRKLGKVSFESKSYRIRDGDIVEILFHA